MDFLFYSIKCYLNHLHEGQEEMALLLPGALVTEVGENSNVIQWDAQPHPGGGCWFPQSHLQCLLREQWAAPAPLLPEEGKWTFISMKVPWKTSDLQMKGRELF